jgi:hypothetical protein
MAIKINIHLLIATTSEIFTFYESGLVKQLSH